MRSLKSYIFLSFYFDLRKNISESVKKNDLLLRKGKFYIHPWQIYAHLP